MESMCLRSKTFLTELKNRNLADPCDDFVQPVLAKYYAIAPEDVEGEICDWALNFLEQRKCPRQLALYLAKIVSNKLSASIRGKYLSSSLQLLDAVLLHTDVVDMIHDVSDEMLNQPDFDQDFNDMIRSEKAFPCSASVAAIKNKRRKMEDRHVVIHDLNMLLDLKDIPAHSYYAVFDGHAGIDAASFAAAHLHSNITRHAEFVTNTSRAIKEAYKLTDLQFCQRASKEGIKSGCTAVTALIRDNTLYLAWLGDSQAVLVKQGAPVTIMLPHKPDRPDERQRIEELGGFVCHLGTWRVNGTLAVSRALGDLEFKPYVSSVPEVNVIPLDGTEDFLILACDGLWDGLSPEDVAAILYSHLSENSPHVLEDTVAEKLVHQSKQQGSDDNITVIVIFLRSILDISRDACDNFLLTKQSQNENYTSDSKCMCATERPKSLLDVNSFPSLHTEPMGIDLKGSIASSHHVETTVLSELPTPPIDDIASSQQLSELYISREGENNQLVSSNPVFQSADFKKKLINLSDIKSTNDLEDSLQANTTVASSVLLDTDKGMPSEISPHFDTNVAEERADHPCSMSKEAVKVASDIVTNTLKAAIMCVNSSEMQSGISPLKQNSDAALSAVEVEDSPFTVMHTASVSEAIGACIPNIEENNFKDVAAINHPLAGNELQISFSDVQQVCQSQMLDTTTEKASNHISVESKTISLESDLSTNDIDEQISFDCISARAERNVINGISHATDSVLSETRAGLNLLLTENGQLDENSRVVATDSSVSVVDIEQTVALSIDVQDAKIAISPTAVKTGVCSSNEVANTSVGGGQTEQTVALSINVQDAKIVISPTAVKAGVCSSNEVANTSVGGVQTEQTVALSTDVKDTKILISSSAVKNGVNSCNEELDLQVSGDIQDGLLEVSNMPDLEANMTDDAQMPVVALDLEAIPDGVPEADGVCEDSDSEKDCGWSYVKAKTDNSLAHSTQPSKVTQTKIGTAIKRETDLLAKSKKSQPELSRSVPKQKVPLYQSKKASDVKNKVILPQKSSALTAKQIPISKAPSKILPNTEKAASLPSRAGIANTPSTGRSMKKTFPAASDQALKERSCGSELLKSSAAQSVVVKRNVARPLAKLGGLPVTQKPQNSLVSLPSKNEPNAVKKVPTKTSVASVTIDAKLSVSKKQVQNTRKPDIKDAKSDASKQVATRKALCVPKQKPSRQTVVQKPGLKEETSITKKAVTPSATVRTSTQQKSHLVQQNVRKRINDGKSVNKNLIDTQKKRDMQKSRSNATNAMHVAAKTGDEKFVTETGTKEPESGKACSS